MEEWAKFFALVDLFEAYHGSVPKSVKFYYNPVKGLFQPLLFDGHVGAGSFDEFTFIDLIIDEQTLSCDWICIHRSFYLAFLSNKEFYEHYLRSIDRITSNEFIQNIEKIYRQKYRKIDAYHYSRLAKNDVVAIAGLNYYFFQNF